jgi:hypothetical protein
MKSRRAGRVGGPTVAQNARFKTHSSKELAVPWETLSDFVKRIGRWVYEDNWTGDELRSDSKSPEAAERRALAEQWASLIVFHRIAGVEVDLSLLLRGVAPVADDEEDWNEEEEELEELVLTPTDRYRHYPVNVGPWNRLDFDWEKSQITLPRTQVLLRNNALKSNTQKHNENVRFQEVLSRSGGTLTLSAYVVRPQEAIPASADIGSVQVLRDPRGSIWGEITAYAWRLLALEPLTGRGALARLDEKVVDYLETRYGVSPNLPGRTQRLRALGEVVRQHKERDTTGPVIPGSPRPR